MFLVEYEHFTWRTRSVAGLRHGFRLLRGRGAEGGGDIKAQWRSETILPYFIVGARIYQVFSLL